MIPKIRRILYTTDLSPNSDYVFRYAVSSAEMHNAKMDILYVSQDTPVVFPDGGVVEGFRKEKSSILAAIKKWVEDFVRTELKEKTDLAGRIASITVVEGNPVVEILRKADEWKPDLLIMGTHGKGTIAQTFLGSAATDILQRSRVPVFIVPLPKT